MSTSIIEPTTKFLTSKCSVEANGSLRLVGTEAAGARSGPRTVLSRIVLSLLLTLLLVMLRRVDVSYERIAWVILAVVAIGTAIHGLLFDSRFARRTVIFDIEDKRLVVRTAHGLLRRTEWSIPFAGIQGVLTKPVERLGSTSMMPLVDEGLLVQTDTGKIAIINIVRRWNTRDVADQVRKLVTSRP